jgi:signal transduction histidine kinase
VVHLSVQDDGRGLVMSGHEPSLRLGGRGLRNLRVRAARIGARVRFYDARPGLGVEFIFERPESGFVARTNPVPL